MEQKEGQQSPPLGKEKEVGQVKSKATGSKKLLIIGCVVAFIVGILAIGGVAAYFLLKNGDEEEEESTTTTTTIEDTSEEDGEDEEESDEEGDSLVPVDSEWSSYTNYDLGFSIYIPSEYYHAYGDCRWSTEDGDHSYRPDPKLVPTKVFVDEDYSVVFISSEYYSELSGETVDAGRHYYSECNRITNTLARVQEEDNHFQQMWMLEFETISSDAELADFIEDRYGSGCELGDKTPTDQEGVYDVSVGGEFGLEDDPGICNLNYETAIIYYPEESRLAVWDVGQACAFYTEGHEACYDQEMIESFRFE
ncbi:MAG: hypothetical protein ACFFDI_14330 [Promethearchaeota archaeon]